ncbi:MAG: hemolysin family protein [Mycoplasma sp.]
MNDVAHLVLLGILLLLLIVSSAFFSGFESAINSINKFQFQNYYKKKKKGYAHKIVEKFLNNIQMTLSTVLIGNTLVNVLATTLSTIFFTNLVLHFGGNDTEAIATGLTTGVMTFLTLIFGEFIPKIIARRNNVAYARFSSYVMYFFYYLFWPLSWCLNKLFKVKKSKSATESELHTLVEIIEREGVLETEEASLVRNAIKFDEIRINRIMTKLNKVISIESNSTKEIISDIFINNPHSRLPITNSNGKYMGFITFKDFFSKYTKDPEFKLEEIIKPTIYVSQYTTLDDILYEMKVHQCHLAFVKKNNDSTKIMGIITLEDLMESLVGEIYDESDGTNSVIEINESTWRVDGDVNAHRFFERYFDIEHIDKKLTIKEYLKEEFKIKRLFQNDKYENDLMTVTIIKDKYKKELVFVIQIKKNFKE